MPATTTRKRSRRESSQDEEFATTNPAANISTAHDGLVDEILVHFKADSTITKSGWCLRQGLSHIIEKSEGTVLPSVMQSSGPPTIYQKHCRHDTDAVTNMKQPSNCFESLCRIIAGQQLAGAAAQSVWHRLLETTKNTNLTPKGILKLAHSCENGLVTRLQKPSGLSAAKARSILDLSQHFESGNLSEAFLTRASADEIRIALLKVKGLGPWSCDMFLLFYLEHADILPLGDLGVRKGMAKLWNLKGNGKNGSLCPKRDAERLVAAAEPFAPYRSLFAYYMWKVAYSNDTKKTVAVVTPEKKKKRNK